MKPLDASPRRPPERITARSLVAGVAIIAVLLAGVAAVDYPLAALAALAAGVAVCAVRIRRATAEGACRLF